MAKPFKFRHTNAIVGVFVLIAGLALLASIVAAGRARQWFESTRLVTLKLPAEGSLGLKAGADVMMLGLEIGSVAAVDPGSEDKPPSALLRVRTDSLKIIRKDSVVKIAKTLGIAGDAFVEITRGRGEKLGQSDALVATQDENYSKIAEDVLAQVRAEVIPTIQELRATLTETRLAVEQLRDPKGDLQRSLVAIRAVLTDIEGGRGLLGQLVQDEQLAANAAALLPRLNASLDDLRLLMADLKKTTETLPELAQSTSAQVKALGPLVLEAQETARALGPLIEETRQTMRRLDSALDNVSIAASDLPASARNLEQATEIAPGLLLQAQETLRQVQRLAESLQRNWLIGGGGGPPAPAGAGSRLIPPEAVGVGGGK